jgi:hypothetical protein
VDDAFQNHLTRIIDGLAEDISIGLALDKDLNLLVIYFPIRWFISFINSSFARENSSFIEFDVV